MTRFHNRLRKGAAAAAFIAMTVVGALGLMSTSVSATMSGHDRVGNCANPGGGCTSSLNGTYWPESPKVPGTGFST